MAYLGLDIDALIRELDLLMENNFNGDVTKDNFNEKFNLAGDFILNYLKELIEEQKEDILEGFKEQWEERKRENE